MLPPIVLLLLELASHYQHLRLIEHQGHQKTIYIQYYRKIRFWNSIKIRNWKQRMLINLVSGRTGIEANLSFNKSIFVCFTML